MPDRRKQAGRQGGIRAFAQRGLGERPPWWGRLEARITISLVAIGILCVGASSYLVALTVRYYDELGRQHVAVQDETLALVEPYYEELASAQRQAFEAHTELLAHDLTALAALGEPAGTEALVAQWVSAHEDVAEVVLERPRHEVVIVTPQGTEAIAGWLRVPIPRELPGPTGAEPAGLLRVTWAVDPAIQARHQRLGELTRDLGKVEVTAGGEDRKIESNEVQRAVIAALGVASSLMLFVAILAGILIARRTTRKVSDLSTVMRRVASGDLSVRAPRLGRDELGQLAAAFNTMLDELEDTRRRITYLQRIGAWQEMARRIAHEIKNPLTPIQLAVQQLREKDPGHDQSFSALLRDSVEIVEDEVESLRRMVTSFSQFAKVPAVTLEQVELGRVLGEFERAYADAMGAELIVEPLGLTEAGDDELWVMGDRQLLKQVLFNLVENATLSAVEAGIVEPQVRVHAERLPERGQAAIVVEDNGPGVEQVRRELIFEPYETTRERGSGLGLAIVKKIVLDHGGEIVVGESEALGGARFELRVPLAEGP